MTLTEKSIPLVSVPEGAVRARVADSEQPGLYLVVGKRSRVWSFKRRNRWITIGPWPAWSIQAARARARELTVQSDSGRPVGLTVARAFDLWLKAKVKRSPVTVLHTRGVFNRAFADWANRDLTRITREEMVRRHAKLARERGPMSARIAVVCFAAWWRQAQRLDPLLPESPTIAVDLDPIRERDAGDLYVRLHEWRKGIEVFSPVRQALYRFALLTGMRRASLLDLRWSDIGADSLVVRAPKRARGKDPSPYVIPLEPAHFEVLDMVRGMDAERVFPVSDGVPGPAEARRYVGPTFTPHLLRHCFLSAGAESGVNSFALSILVNHRIGGMAGTYVTKVIDTRPTMQAIIDRLTSRMGLG